MNIRQLFTSVSMGYARAPKCRPLLSVCLFIVCACEPSTSADESDPGTLVDMDISLDGAMLTDATDHPNSTDVQVFASDLSVGPDARTAFDAAMQADVESPGSVADMGSPMAPPQSEYSVEHMDVMVSYQTQRPAPFQNENREMTLRIYYPRALNADARLIVVSHGGPGSERGHMALAHLGQHYASRGYVAAHIGHRSSPGNTEHRWDRPHDVRAVINYFESADSAELEGMNGGVGTDAVGHIGHSWGAYTAHGVAGGDFRVSNGREDVWRFRDERVVAIVALSPQGPGGFGAYDVVCDRAGGVCPDNGWNQASDDNTWAGIDIPTFHLIGEAEMDGVAGIETGDEEAFRGRNWRAYPYVRVPTDGRRYASVLPEATHADLGSRGTRSIQAYIATNSRLFFDMYLGGDESARDEIGRAQWIEGIDHRRK